MTSLIRQGSESAEVVEITDCQYTECSFRCLQNAAEERPTTLIVLADMSDVMDVFPVSVFCRCIEERVGTVLRIGSCF